MARSYAHLRVILLKASQRQVRNGNPPLIGFDEFLTVFEEGEELPYRDWSLARDLLLIRVIEQLYAYGWFARNPEVLAEETEREEKSLGEELENGSFNRMLSP